MRDGVGENQKNYNCKNPMRIRYNEEYLTMYQQPRQMRINAQKKPPVPSLPPKNKYTPATYPPGWTPDASGQPQPGPRGPLDPSQGGSFPLPSGAWAPAPGPSLPQQYFYPCEAEGDAMQKGSRLALEQIKLENKMVQREVLVLVEEICGGPICETMKARMKRLLQKLRSLILAFDPAHPADGRRMVQLLVNYQLPGYEICLFLGNVMSLYSDFISFFAQDDVAIWRPCREVQQFYLHMAFSLDSVFLFKFIINFGKLFAGPTDVFKWEELLYVLMEHRDRFRPFFAALLASRLKSRVQKRLVEEGSPQEIKNKYPPEPVKYPCEERLLTHKVLSDYGSLFSKEEAKEFNELLKRWKYGAARQETDIRRANAAATAANRSSSRTRTFPPSSAPQVFWA
ncbi:hypothetical protein, conserved [Eimeria maxima]|uniref:Uncharacterized protein n=1 Tax=Eimeria maxima TaxID=5804 RepID=U6MFH3_EIMMA|nr:hypothetical protein, conserved [Eimeria maxima]CDJ61798.1 hypothetical protein, conserved [Eimeria maxima]